MERLKCAAVFIICFVVFIFGFKALDDLIAHELIQRDTQLLSEKLIMYIDDSAAQLRSLPVITEDYQCSDTNQQQLSMAVFNSSFIRWAAVMNGLKVECRSQLIPRKVEKLVKHRIGENLHMAVIKQVDSEVHELFLVHHAGKFQYVASIIPMNPRYFVPVHCDDCLEYSITIDGIEDTLAAVPMMEFGFNEFEGNHVVVEQVSQQTQHYIAKFTLSGNEAFFGQYQTLNWWHSGVLSLLFSMLVAIAYWLWKYTHLSMGSQIKRAIKNDEFIPFYQPVISARTRQIMGAEVLMRWQQGNGDLIPPNQFIPFAESAGFIVDMTYSMLDIMVADIETAAHQLKPLFFCINIVPEHLDDDKLYRYIKALKESGKLGQHRISLEITERQPIVDLVKARKMLDKFYAIGVDLKLDDAGMGYGGFNYVKNLGISTLKIDKAFIDTIGVKDNFNEKTLDAIISFANKSGLTVIAEGVETQQQLAYLQSQGVDLIQGYVFSKPLSFYDFFTNYSN
ncbi:EAL domain-containing protein [Shewanella sp. UCD-KL21]|uniref:EAL domain-containing protein n=1 Tax=Shewanella sp. UCD-KL21 TaxID=1917164 RepID=UPI000970E2F3|nr:EAL domain-containing protein [Shewanella sp. UCD-KL21]